jgi:hypothetical protein
LDGASSKRGKGLKTMAEQACRLSFCDEFEICLKASIAVPLAHLQLQRVKK